jgi:hypothetical protein
MSETTTIQNRIAELDAEADEMWAILYAIRDAKNVTPGNKHAAAAMSMMRKRIAKIYSEIESLEG